ncbi:hypothetical protein Tco_1387163 [Tanacetum coccineum]
MHPFLGPKKTNAPLVLAVKPHGPFVVLAVKVVLGGGVVRCGEGGDKVAVVEMTWWWDVCGGGGCGASAVVAAKVMEVMSVSGDDVEGVGGWWRLR